MRFLAPPGARTLRPVARCPSEDVYGSRGENVYVSRGIVYGSYALLELRRAERSPEEWAKREQRLIVFTNQVLEMGFGFLPREVRRAWKGSAPVDATVIPTFARPARRERRTKKGVLPKTIRHSADPDAHWYHRDKREGKGGESDPRSRSGGMRPPSSWPAATIRNNRRPCHRSCLAWCSTSPATKWARTPSGHWHRCRPASTRPPTWPRIAPTHSRSPRTSSSRPVPSATSRSSTTRSISSAARAADAGMMHVDGTWYCPGMPETLINATKQFRKGVIDEVTHRARIEERRRYQIRTKGVPDAAAHVRMRCPASQPAPTVRCANKPASEGGDGKARLRIPVTDALALHPPKICSQQSVTLPPEAGAKFAQELPMSLPSGTRSMPPSGTRSRA